MARPTKGGTAASGHFRCALDSLPLCLLGLPLYRSCAANRAVHHWNRRAGWLAFAMAGLLAISRVVVGTHYPTDVLAGAVIGIAALFFWLPPIRKPLHRFAGWLAGVYESLVAAASARLRASSA